MSKLLLRKPVWGAVGLGLVAALVVSVMALTGGGGDRAEAAVIPDGCTGGGIQQTLNRTPAVAHVGDTITYEITVFNGPFPSCQITEIKTTFTTPDGALEVLLSGVTLNPGESSATFVRTYVIAAGDIQPDDSVEAKLYSEGKLQDHPLFETDTSDYDEAVTTVVHPCLEVTKEVDPEVSKEGDDVEYEICVSNCGDIDLERISVDDDLLGDKSGDFEDVLPVAGTECELYPYTIPPGAEDPLVNTVTATYWDGWALPPEIAQTLVETASAEVDLVHPCLEVDKECSEVSKVGDEIDYSVTIHNCSPVDEDVDIEIDDVVDSLAGDLADCDGVVLSPSGTCTIDYSREVLPGDDPGPGGVLVNEVDVDGHVVGLGNPVEAGAECGTPIVHPCLEVDKECSEVSKVGDEIDYSVTIHNCSPVDEDVDIEIDDVVDSLAGDLADCDGAVLPPSGTCTIDYSREVLPGDDPGPGGVLVNEVDVDGHVVGLGNPVEAWAECGTPIVHPCLEVDKECSEVSKVGDEIDYSVTIHNCSPDDVDIEIDDVADSLAGDLLGCDGAVLPPSGTCTIDYSREVLPGDDPGPGGVLVNEVDVDGHVVGLGNPVEAGAECGTPIVHPCLEVDKECSEVSKVGDEIDYSVTIHNCSPVDEDVDIEIDDVVDSLAGDLADCDGVVLSPSGTCTIDYSREVLPGDDPGPGGVLVNEVDVDGHVVGLGNPVEAGAECGTPIVHPCLEVDKECSEVSKVGDEIDYSVTIHNCSPVDEDVDIEIDDVVDSLAGDLADCDGAVLPPSGTCTIDYSREVLPGDDPGPGGVLVNEVDVDGHVVGLGNPVEAGAECGTPIVHPCLEVDKECSEMSKVGDEIDYSVTIHNCSPDDVDIEIDDVADSLAGDLVGCDGAVLPPSGTCTIDYSREVLPGDDPGPGGTLWNEVDVDGHVVGLGNPLEATAECGTGIVHPDFEISKVCSPDLIPVGDPITWTVTVENTGDVTLHIEVSDPTAGISETVVLAAGASQTITRSRPVTVADAPAISNTVTAVATLPPDLGLPNEYTKEASDSCMVEVGGEGCTPGYWKQPQHFDSWTAPYDPPDKFSDVFGRLITVRANVKRIITDPTLLQALQANGGGINALVRHGVAALLNAASPGVAYAFSPAAVIAMVQGAIDSGDYETTKNLLAAENERGCPLN